jgi:hypothetical protein
VLIHTVWVLYELYTVPLPKVKNCRIAAMTCDDFRGIATSSILSKVFEHCILDRFRDYFYTNDNQIGFRKNLRYSHAILTINDIVGHFVCGDSTLNLGYVQSTYLRLSIG